MLVILRKESERITIGDDIVIMIVKISGDRVKVGIEAPVELPIHREDAIVRIAKVEGEDSD